MFDTTFALNYFRKLRLLFKEFWNIYAMLIWKTGTTSKRDS